MVKTLKTLVVVGAAIGFAACSSKPKTEAPKEQTAAERAAAGLQAEQTSYVQRTEARVAQLGQMVTDLRAKAATAEKPQNKKIENAAEDLSTLLGDVRKSLDEVKGASGDSWIAYKRDVEKAMSRAEIQYSNSISLLQ
jgi:hypothetical protein